MNSEQHLGELRKQWLICVAMSQLIEDELYKFSYKKVLAAGIRSKRLLKAMRKSLQQCIGMTSSCEQIIKLEEKANRNGK